MNTLRELAELASRVADKYVHLNAVQTAKQFDEFQDELNMLQIVVPCFRGMFEVRVAWYTLGLSSFVDHFVVPIEQKVEGWDKWHQNYTSFNNSPPDLLMHYETLWTFLRRSYLGTHGFCEIYPYVELLFGRLVAATQGTPLNKL